MDPTSQTHSDVREEDTEKWVATPTKRRKWWLMGLGLAALVVVIIAVVVPTVVVTQQQKNNSGPGNLGDTNPPFYAHAISPYANLTRLKVRNDLESKERIFVIGDVHGCSKELQTMLDTLGYRPGPDQIILAGDLTATGPDSQGVLNLVREQGILCVRGNHDDKVIRFKTYENMYGVQPMDTNTPLNEGDVMDPLEFGNEHDHIARFVKRCSHFLLLTIHTP